MHCICIDIDPGNKYEKLNKTYVCGARLADEIVPNARTHNIFTNDREKHKIEESEKHK